MDAFDVAHRLAHLRAAEVQHAVVQPPARERRAAVRALALSDLVLVVRELQVDAAGVDVDGGAQVRLGHRRALDVPARTAAAPGRVPAGQVVGGRLPQHEVAGIALVRRHFDTRAGQHVVRVAARELAVAGEAGHREQHVAFRGIGMAVGDQALDHRDDLRDVLGCLRLDVGRELAIDTQRGHVLAVGGGVLVGDRGDRGAEFLRRRVDLVVHVGDVARVAQAAETAAQQRSQHPEHDRPARVADMHVVVDRGPAHIHGRAGGIERRERLDPARQGVVEVQAAGRRAHGDTRMGSRIVAARTAAIHPRWTPRR